VCVPASPLPPPPRYVENQSLLTSADDQLSCQAATITSLQQQLQAARGASGRSQKQRIQELEAQVGGEGEVGGGY